MKRWYIFFGLLGLGILITGCITSTPSSSRVPSNIDDLAAMELNLPDNYADQLIAVIKGTGDPYFRERAVFTLARIALAQNETSIVIPLLKDLAMHSQTDEIRTAAYANLYLIKTTVPPPTYGYLNLSVEGTIKKGSPIRLVAEVSSTVPVTASVVGIRRLPQGMDLNSDAIVRLSLQPNEPQNVVFQMTPQLVGTYSIPVSLVLSLDQVESFERTTEVSITVQEHGGNYSVRAWELVTPEGELASMTMRASPS